MFTKTLLKPNKIQALYNTVQNIATSQELSALYLNEIEQMNPNIEYETLSQNTIIYLKLLLENICGAYNLGYQLSSDEYILLENEVYKTIAKV